MEGCIVEGVVIK